MKQAVAQPGPGKVLLRTQNGSSGPYRAFNFVFAGIFAIVAALAIFYNPNTFLQFQWWGLLAAVVVGCGVFVLVNLLFSQIGAGNKWAEPTVAILLFAALITAQVFVGWELRIDVGASPWDFDVVYLAARDYVLNGAMPDTYFELFPGNIGMYSVLCLWFGIFRQIGITDFTLPAIILNIICIDLAVLFTYLSARLLMGKSKSLFILVASVFTVPFLLYMPILYTDTVSLVFPIAVVYLWLRARQCWRKGDVGGTMGRFIWLSVLVAAGALIKMTVVIIYIAIVIDLMLMLVGSARWLVLLAGAVSFAALFFGGGWLLRNSGLLPSYNYENGIPFTHWIMMGLQGDGGYNDDDYKALLASAATKAGRSSFAMEQIQDRLGDYGFGGTMGHIVDKLRYTWGDATYYAASKLDHRKIQESSVLFAYVIPTGTRFAWLAYGSFAVHGAMLVGMVVGSIKSVLRKNDALTFVRIAVFGLLLFLLIWETRSRYLVNYLPLMLLVAMEALPMARPMQKKGRGGEAENAPKDKPAKKDAPAKKDKNSKKQAAQEESVKVEDILPELEEPAHTAPSAAASLFGEATHEETTAKPADANIPPDQPENLFDQPRKTKVVNTVHTEIFDVPTGDPFYEMAHTASWQVSEVLEVDEDAEPEAVPEAPTAAKPAGAQTQAVGQPHPQAQPTGAQVPFAEEFPVIPLPEGTQPSGDVEELFSLLEEVTPEIPATPAPVQEPATQPETRPEEKRAPNLNDAFTRAAYTALSGEQAREGQEPDLFSSFEMERAGGPAPLPPAGRTPQDLAAEKEESDLPPGLPNEAPAGLDSLWDFDD